MKFKRYATMENGLHMMSMAPLIDVIFLLLIFFMLSSSFTFSPGIDVKLPKAVTSDTVQEDNVVITITSENIIYWHNKIIAVKDLKVQLAQLTNKSAPILIKADRRASVGRIVDVWDLCRALGIERINIATDREQ